MASSKPKVFISYAREDSNQAEKLYADLMSAGIDTWLDTKNIPPGIEWATAIRKAINDSRYFLALLSNNSVEKRGHVQKELRAALEILDEFPETQVYLIPIRLEACTPSFERLTRLQWVDLFPLWEQGVDRILWAIQYSSSNEGDDTDSLNSFILSHIDTKTFEIPEIWGDKYAKITWWYDDDEEVYITWDPILRKVEKIHSGPMGNKWSGPHELTEYDRKRVKEYLLTSLKQPLS